MGQRIDLRRIASGIALLALCSRQDALGQGSRSHLELTLDLRWCLDRVTTNLQGHISLTRRNGPGKAYREFTWKPSEPHQLSFGFDLPGGVYTVDGFASDEVDAEPPPACQIQEWFLLPAAAARSVQMQMYGGIADALPNMLLYGSVPSEFDRFRLVRLSSPLKCGDPFNLMSVQATSLDTTTDGTLFYAQDQYPEYTSAGPPAVTVVMIILGTPKLRQDLYIRVPVTYPAGDLNAQTSNEFDVTPELLSKAFNAPKGTLVCS